ncbi:sodium-dependent transporter [Mangrovimicrobium sediminis]|uniref:Sodium-dependent transporter n=1 Tax=Mangrovimicrobium sediminis TaxID=2562682 RepID=A0A4Z0M3P6_9GAMM|nr:sodium-dependent transporter [Haliea sp. SAOS-164]TGD74149.1 sodium-dependent transporter [Haliea sp. SAOS-164]
MAAGPTVSLVGWRSRTTFVLALAAASVGVGSLWRFAWLMGSNGSAAFLLTYVACLLLVAVPLCCAEAALGCTGRASPLLAIRRAAQGSEVSGQWRWLGLLAAFTGFLLAGSQVVVAGWSLGYLNLMRGDVFSAASVPEVAKRFGDLVEDTAMQIRWQSVFVVLLTGVLALGVRRGLSLLFWLAVPAMLALLALLVSFAFDTGDLEATRNFLFNTRLLDFDVESALLALGQALLAMGTGVGAVLMFGAYSPDGAPIGRSVMAVALFHTVVALLAGLALLPLVTASNMLPAGGPGLVFIGAPYAYGNLIQGEFYGVLFYALMGITALAAAVAMLEPAVALVNQHLGLSRPAAAAAVTLPLWILAWAIAASVSSYGWMGQHNLLVSVDHLAARLLLPLVALGTAVFVGWRLRADVLRPRFAREADLSFSLWRGLLRYITPPALALILWAGYFR